eukprot:06302.XXX_52067_53225_1 [CDS] Oithona nana genome sequencing.
MVHVDRCETYMNRECTTNQTMSCEKEMMKKCRPVTVTEPSHKCFNVTTKNCFYDEKVEYEVVETYLPKQVCYSDKVPICNTMYKIVNGTIPREVCTNVPQTYCNKETKVVEDKTCQTETKIECTSSPSSSFEKSVSYKSGSSSGGYDDQDVKYSSSNGRSSVGHSSCHKKLETKCFTTPREVTMVNCFTQNERSCEYINEPAPRVVYEDECREYEKRHCQMEQRPQKKQIKKYVYNIRCEPRTHRPCQTFNVAKVSTHCEPEFYDKCRVVPHEKCHETPKETCFKEPVMVKRTKCDHSGTTRTGTSDYPSTSSRLSENSFTADQY